MEKLKQNKLLFLALLVFGIGLLGIMKTQVGAVGEELTIDAPTTFTGTNVLKAYKFVDTAGSDTYFLDPSAATSMVLAGSATVNGFTSTGTVTLSETTSIGNVSSTELGYLDGVTSAVQTQINTKAPTASPTFTGSVTMPGTGIWNSSGNVGIGTTSPGGPLDIYTAGTSANTLTIQSQNASYQTYPASIAFKNGAADYTTSRIWSGFNGGGSWSNTQLRLQVPDANGTLTDSLTVKAGSAGNSGSVGIGTTSPGYKLDVAGDIRAQSAWLRTTGDTGWYSDSYGGGWYMSDTTWIRSYGSKNVYVNTIVRADGGFQVDATTSIAADNSMHYTYGSGKYDAFGTVNASGWGLDANNNGSWDLLVYNGGQLYYNEMYLGYGGAAAIRTYDAGENLSLIPNGSVLIGSTYGTLKLDVGGAMRVENSSHQIRIYDTDSLSDEWSISTYNNNDLALFENVATVRFRFAAGGTAYTNGGSWTNGGADFAEYFMTTDTSIDKGEIVSIDTESSNKVLRADKSDKQVVGVISTKPGFLGNMTSDISKEEIEMENDPRWKVVGLVGQIPTKVTNENGEIKPGDPITISSVPGVGMKATKPGYIVGHALEAYNSTAVGKINVLVQPSWYDPDPSNGRIDTQQKEIESLKAEIDEIKKRLP